MADLLYRVENAVATIQLNRPGHKNAFTLEMIDAWAERLEQAGRDPGVHAIVTTGSGDSFCAGVDLDVMAALQRSRSALQWKQVLWERVHKVAFALERIDKPVIAAVNGVAVGAGMDMALMCDMRFMARSASFSEGYVRVGAVPGDGACHYLPRLVGRAKALELLLTGDFIGADEVLRIGLANRVHDDAQLLAQTQAFAERLAANSPIAMRTIKRAVDQCLRSDLRTSLDLISSHMGVVLTTDDAAEALAAFKDRRQPTFTGA
ncbi:enoyl-CoA hydratase/isomerase family protein [Pseudorhodoferax sp.]|uniref:enoyl-CoA hydratase/isomerase family protein n=1 Tax=Pseudorhodoferax sp. TaxID=1993553 RepID=UPI002DD65C09|nr:enoyl-CoA hydratase-related protein [Pseudorhodoferax sp.]